MTQATLRPLYSLMQKKIALSILSALLLAAPFLFPPLFPLAWVAFVPLFWVIHQAESWRGAVFFGWLTGFVAHLIGFHWLVYTISVFGGFSYPFSAVIFLIYAALQGLEIALFAVVLKPCGFGPLALFAPLFWVTIEFWFPLLFPWFLANSQISLLPFIQSADLVGPYGASFLVMWGNSAVHRLIFGSETDRQLRWLPAAYVALIFSVSVLYGIQRLGVMGEEIAAAPKLSVAAVQGDIDINMKWNPKLVKQNLEKYYALTKQIDDASLVIWPETAIELWLPDELGQLPADLLPPFPSERPNFIFGARSFLGNPSRGNLKAFNTAFLTDAKGRVLGRYHKQVLLAFGEYLPFSEILSHLPAVPFADGFTAGTAPLVFYLSRGVRIAPLICYEDLMPQLARQFVGESRANLLVNLTNDAWYGNTVAPWQHLRLAQWRAIETRRTLLRVTNTGVTSVIDATGQLAQSLPLFMPAVLNAQVAILNDQTFYVRFGDWFAWGATFISLAIILIGFKRWTQSA